MKATSYLRFAALLAFVGCAHPRPVICESYPEILRTLVDGRAEIDRDSPGRVPASDVSADRIGSKAAARNETRVPLSSRWTMGILRNLQDARDPLEVDRHHAEALRALTDAANQATYLVGYLQSGRRRESLRTIYEIQKRVESARSEVCGP